MANIECYDTGTLIKQSVNGSDIAIWITSEETYGLYEKLKQRFDNNSKPEGAKPRNVRSRKSNSAPTNEQVHDTSHAGSAM